MSEKITNINMSKQEQVLLLEPDSELHFTGPFTDVVTSYLKLTNPLDRRVCFKVKTTAPKKYCVRPNSGIIMPKKTINVAVMLQPFVYNPNEKNKHKFMVQTLIAPDGDVNVDNLWLDAKPESLMDSKLKCVFELPEELSAKITAQNNNLDPHPNTVQGEEKTAISKVVAEPTVKSSPKTAPADSELKKMHDENKMLRDEIHLIKQENAQLKAEGLRQRSRANPASETGSQSSQQAGKDYSKPFYDSTLQEQPQSPMLYLAVILTIGLLGIFIGKFVV